MKRWRLVVMLTLVLFAPLAAQSLDVELQRAIQRETANSAIRKSALADYRVDLVTGPGSRVVPAAGPGELSASPDGRFAAAAASSGQAGADGLDSALIAPTTGGEPREVFRPGSGKR